MVLTFPQALTVAVDLTREIARIFDEMATPGPRGRQAPRVGAADHRVAEEGEGDREESHGESHALAPQAENTAISPNICRRQGKTWNLLRRPDHTAGRGRGSFA